MTSIPSQVGSAEMLAWADEVQALIDAGDIRESDLRKANATAAALRSAATIQSAEVGEAAGKIANRLAYEIDLYTRNMERYATYTFDPAVDQFPFRLTKNEAEFILRTLSLPATNAAAGREMVQRTTEFSSAPIEGDRNV